MNTNSQTPGAGLLKPSEALTRFRGTLTTGVARATSTTQTCYGFRVGSIGLLIELHTASEVFIQVPIQPLPNAAAGFHGLCNLRGNIVPVYDLETLLEIPCDQAARLLLVLGKGETAVGVLIRELPGLLPLEQAHPVSQLPPLPEWLGEHVLQGYLKDNTLWLAIDQQALFATLAKRLAA